MGRGYRHGAGNNQWPIEAQVLAEISGLSVGNIYAMFVQAQK